MHARRILTTGILMVALALPRIGLCIFGVGDVAVVIDPGNIEQTTMAVQGIATTIEQQKQMIQDQLTMVTQGAKNLLATPLDMMNQVKSLTDQYNQALADVKGIGYTVDSAKAQWESLFGAGASGKSLPEQAMAISQALQQAGAQASQMQAIYSRLCDQLTMRQTALQAVQAAPGSLAAIQAQTQLQAVLSDQLNTLTQMQMTEGRAHIIQIADDARTSEQAAKNSANWIRGFNDADNMPVGFGQGKGPTLD